MISGRIVQNQTICCLWCGHWDVSGDYTSHLASVRFKNLGWGRVHNQWFCPRCLLVHRRYPGIRVSNRLVTCSYCGKEADVEEIDEFVQQHSHKPMKKKTSGL